jgi:FkbM family methyltransferase
MIVPVARSLYRWTAQGCAEALVRLPAVEPLFVGIGSRLADRPGIGRFYRSVAFRFAERLRRAGSPYRRIPIAGEPMTVDVTEFTTHDLYFSRRRYEPRTTDFLIETLKPGDVFVDVGASHGYFTLIAASRVGPAGRVYAFEPNPPVFRQLAAHVRLNGYDGRVRLADIALSDTNGQATFFVSRCATNSGLSSLQATEERLREGLLSTHHTVRVTAETFDSWYARIAPGPIAVVKIDVEGAEDRVFDGMVSTLRSGAIGSIVCETEWDRGVPDRFAALGYAARPLESTAGYMNLVFTRSASGSC